MIETMAELLGFFMRYGDEKPYMTLLRLEEMV
jgi:hypothetical protein